MKNRALFKALTAGCLGFATVASNAQFDGVRSLFSMSNLIDNPASAGASPCLDMRLGVRSQWAGFEGAPMSSFASLSSQMGRGMVMSHGLGGYVMTDDIGPGRPRDSACVFVEVRLTNGASLSAGMAAGWFSTD